MRVTADWLTAPGARAVMSLLADAGHQAWFVGGCVRNAVLGCGATDVDIATDAVPQDVIALGAAAGMKVVPTGVDHGTVTLVAGGVPYEVTTFRRDVETDGRRAVVAFARTLQEDARRRDFTMNALYANASGEVTDPVGGLADIGARRVRFIGEPEARIREDYLRILRFFRFYALYGDPDHGIDAEGLAACAELAAGVEGLSRERIAAEMRKLLAAPDPAPAVAAMAAAGVLGRVLPGASALALAPLVHVEAALGLEPDPLLRLAALGGEGEAEALRLSRTEACRLAALKSAARGDAGAQELGYRLGRSPGVQALALRHALTATSDLDAAQVDLVRDGAAQRFPVRAADLMPALHGPKLGERLAELEAAWIASGFSADRETLLALPHKTG